MSHRAQPVPPAIAAFERLAAQRLPPTAPLTAEHVAAGLEADQRLVRERPEIGFFVRWARRACAWPPIDEEKTA